MVHGLAWGNSEEAGRLNKTHKSEMLFLNFKQNNIHIVSRKKSHFNFWHNFTICQDIFAIFEALCLEIISAQYSLWHTHYPLWGLYLRWRNIWQSTCCMQCTQTPDFIPPDLWPPNSPDLNPLDYSVWSIMQEKVYQTHIANMDELRH